MLLNLLLLKSVTAATLTVGGTGTYASIQAAIDASIPGDTIEVAAGFYTESLNLSGKDLDIMGVSGSAQTTIQSPLNNISVAWNLGEAGSFQGFTIRPNSARAMSMTSASVVVSDVIIEGGGALGTIDGGAVHITGGAPTFADMEVRDSQGRLGGAFYMETQANVAISDLLIEDTAATFGGAFYLSRSTLTLTTVSLLSPHASSSGGGFYMDDSDVTAVDLEIDSAAGEDTWGVGIFARNRSSVSLTGGSIHDCEASNYISGYHGGGIRAEGNTTLVLDSVDIRDNTAYAGGGLSLTGDTDAVLTDVLFDTNTVVSNGGGIGLTSSSSVDCSGCVFSDNIAGDGGGVSVRSSSIYTDASGVWSGNTATQDGGGIYVNAGSFSVDDGSFTGNSATGGGGGVYTYTPALGIELTNTVFQANTADSDDGGAIAAERSTDLSILECTFDSNSATFGSGGAIAWSTGFYVDDFSIEATDFESNEAGSDGGAIYMNRGDEGSFLELDFLRNTADGDGGAVYINRTNQVHSIRSRYHRNLAAAGSGGAWYESSTSSASTFTNNLVVENQAIDGGALALDSTVDAYVVNNTFVGNDAANTGAHLQVVGGTVRFINNVFAWGLDGGGIYGDSTAAVGSDIYYNDAFDNSGGSYVGAFTNQTGLSGNLGMDPILKSYTLDADEGNDDLHIELVSPCLDAGHPGILDVDASASDIGAYGGPEADVEDADGDGYFDHVDCDDGDGSIFPTAIEIPYDGIDQDCDEEDLRDVDADGFEAITIGGQDCNDNDPSIYPGAPETWYDGIDGDCDGESDFDADSDGYDSSAYPGGDDCNDADAGVSPSAVEVWYDGIDQDCAGNSDFDSDQDGYDSATFGGPDCNDTNATVYTGATEIPYDGFDQDCDGLDLTDVDGDGYDSSSVLGGIDCNDQDPNAYPGAVDTPYNGVDEDCDGWSDFDADFDGFDSASFGGGDCNDSDSSIHPAAFETWYDGLDQDCDAADDFDADLDGYRSPIGGGDDCDDSDPTAHPGSWENWYDGIDQDCLGDDDFDRDKDGFRVLDECDDNRAEAYPDDPDTPEFDPAPELLNGMDDDCDGWAENEDRDSDGLIDWDEWGLGTDAEDADSDDDGVQDGDEVLDPSNPIDSDLDSLIDPLDDDDDGDGILTLREVLVDPNRDGVPDVDVDGDGIPNHLDRDSDGDAYTDEIEGEGDDDRDGIANYVDYTGDYTGGGCGGLDMKWAGILMLGGSLFRRRRSSFFKRPQGASALVWTTLFCAVLWLPTTASANGVDSHGFHLLGTTGDLMRYGRMAYPDGGTRGDIDVSVVADHAVRPLVEVIDKTREPVLEALTTTNLAVSGSVAPWTRVELVLPIHPIGVARDGGFTALGDARVGAVVPVIVPHGRLPGVGLAPSIWLPTGANEYFVGNPGVSIGGVITIAQEIDDLGWVANIGARVGKLEPERNLRAGAGPMVGLGGHYRLTDDVALTLETTVQGTTGWGSWPIEAMAGSRFRLKGGVWGTAGVGAGLNDHTGTSSMRVVAGLGWNKRVEEREVEFIGWFIDPDRDRDGDGFKDLDDACPDQAETVDGFLDDDGCPELDGDADGVPFERDLCPREPIYVEQDPRFSDGCPKIAELAGNRITVTESIFFEENSTRLMPKSDAPLEAIFHELEAHQEVRHLLIEGHTNSNGSASFNYRLGRLRAESVLVWLEKRGVDRNRLIAKGYGFDVPLLPHDHPDATEMNRRVVFLVLRPEGDPGPEPAQTVFPQFSLESEKAATGPIRILEFEGMDFPPEKGAPPREPSASSAVEAPASGSVIAPAEESLPGVSIETVPVEVPEEPAVPVEAPDEEAAGPSEEAMQPAEEASPEPDDLGDLEEDTGRASLFGRRNRSSDESSAPAEEADPPAEEPKPEEPAPDTTPAPQ